MRWEVLRIVRQACVLCACLLVVSACTSDEPTAPTPTPGASSTATTAPSTPTTVVDPAPDTGAATPSSSTTLLTSTTTAPAISDEQRRAAEAVGDIDQGEELFNKANPEMPDNIACSTCHTTNGTVTQWAPTLAGAYERAGLRVDGLSDADYLRQSIVDPYAFVVDGQWAFAMPLGFADVLTQEQIDDLVAFVMTL